MSAFDARIPRVVLRAALATAVACGVTLTTTATADEPNGEPLTKVVSFADLNVNNDAGIRVLHSRLQVAAKQVCRPFTGKTLRQIAESRKCFDQAITQSIKQIDRPALTAHHLDWTGKAETPTQVAEHR